MNGMINKKDDFVLYSANVHTRDTLWVMPTKDAIVKNIDKYYGKK